MNKTMYDLGDSIIESLLSSRADLSSAIAAGNVRDWDEYRYTVGQIKGIDEAIEVIENVIGKADK